MIDATILTAVEPAFIDLFMLFFDCTQDLKKRHEDFKQWQANNINQISTKLEFEVKLAELHEQKRITVAQLEKKDALITTSRDDFNTTQAQAKEAHEAVTEAVMRLNDSIHENLIGNGDINFPLISSALEQAMDKDEVRCKVRGHGHKLECYSLVYSALYFIYEIFI